MIIKPSVDESDIVNNLIICLKFKFELSLRWNNQAKTSIRKVPRSAVV